MIKLFFLYLIGDAAAGFFDVLAIMLITRMVSPVEYGQGMWFISLTNILFCFCVAGMDQVFVRFFYEPKYKENLSLLFYRCLLIIFPCVVIVSMFLFYYCDKIMQWLNIDMFIIIPYFIIDIIFIILLRFLRLISMLMENVKIYNLINFFEKVLGLFIFLVAFYLFANGCWAIIVSQLMSIILVVLWGGFVYRKELVFPLHQIKKIIEKKEAKDFLKFGIPSIFSLGLHILFLNLDKFFILKWSNYHELGIYTAAFALTGPLLMMESIFTTAWVPRLNHMLIHSPFKSRKILSITFEKLNFLMFSFILVSILFKNYILFYVGSDFSQAINVFPWLFFVPYFWALSEVVVAGVVKSKKSYWHIYFSLSALCVNTLGCCLLIPFYGAMGAAISVAISFGVFFLVRWQISFRYYAFKINQYKLITYISFICIYIVFSRDLLSKMALFFAFLCIGVLFEKKWLFKDIASMLMVLYSKYNNRQFIGIVQKNF